MNGLKTLVFSIISTIILAAPPAAAEVGKYGFFMHFSTVGEQVDNFEYNDERVGIMRTADYAADSAGMVQFGYSLGNLRADVEFGVRTLDVENITGAINGSGDMNVYTAMINGAWDFLPMGDMTPYLAFGFGGIMGAGKISYTDSNGDADKANAGDIMPTGHVGIGGRFALSDSAAMTLGYAFLMAASNAEDQGSVSPTHSVTLGLDYKF